MLPEGELGKEPMARAISNSDDIIDSRDVIARISELESDIESGLKLDEDDAEELIVLREFAAEGESCSDWEHGEMLIRDSYFEHYAMDLADDIGAIDRNAHWPTSCIDWKQAAEELQADYTSLDFDGVTYWARS